jgi:hypothetical protein
VQFSTAGECKHPRAATAARDRNNAIKARDLAQSVDTCRFVEYQTRIAEIESSVRLLKVARPFEVDLQRLRIHLRLVKEDLVKWER